VLVMGAAARGSKIRGVQLAIVVDNRDGPGNPGYRVKVKFPWLSEQETSFWTRIAVPMGGPDRGTYVLPEIDDQVLVVFEHGEIERPIVIGALWSKKQEPVEVNRSGNNNTKLIKSRAGHRIVFDDTDGAEKITIVDRTRSNKIVLDSLHRVVKIESDGEIEVVAKANVIVHANALKIGCAERFTGTGTSLLVHAAGRFGLKATSRITIGGGSTTINTSNAAATRVSGSGAGELGGAASKAPDGPIVPSQHDWTAVSARGGGSARHGNLSPRSSIVDPPAIAPEKSFIELELVDTAGVAVAFASYVVTDSGRASFSGVLDADGRARVEGIAVGACTVSFPEFHADDWSAA
jgi:phage baseplate assembly protein gpV